MSNSRFLRVELDGILGPGYQYKNDPSFEADVATDALLDAYADMAVGIHEDVQAAVLNKSAMPYGRNEPTTYINGVAVAHRYVFVAGDWNGLQSQEPEYVHNYRSTRSTVMGVLVERAVQSHDFSFLMSTITSLRDPFMARGLIGEIEREYQRYPDAIAGSVHRVKSMIDGNNRKVEHMGQAIESYGFALRDEQLRKQLTNEKTGALGAIAIGVKSKTRLGVRKALKERLHEPLARIASLPPVEQQILTREQQGISITEDD